MWRHLSTANLFQLFEIIIFAKLIIIIIAGNPKPKVLEIAFQVIVKSNL